MQETWVWPLGSGRSPGERDGNPFQWGIFFFNFNWRLITLQYCGGFCHMFTWENSIETCILSCERDLPVQVRCMRQGAQGWCTGMTLRDGMGREEGGSVRMGKHMHTHGWFNGEVLAWEIPWAVEPGRLESTSHKTVRHYLATKQQTTNLLYLALRRYLD